MPPLPSPPLLLITDRQQARQPLCDVIAAACAGGIRWVSVREKDLPAGKQVALCREITAAASHAVVTLHGDAALALEAGCRGVHLPSGASAARARAILGPQALIGQSIHGMAELAAVEAAHLDYVVAAPAFLTLSKPGYGPALGAAGLARLKAAAAVPLIALGGIDRETLTECRSAGVDGVAIMGGVMRAPDPAEEARALLAAWEAAGLPSVTRD